MRWHVALVNPDQSQTYLGEVDDPHVEAVRAVAASEETNRWEKGHPRKDDEFFVIRDDGLLEWYCRQDWVPEDDGHETEPGAQEEPVGAAGLLGASVGPAYVSGVERLGDQSIGGAMDYPGNPPRVVHHTVEAPSGSGYFTSMASYLIKVSSEPQVLYDPLSDRLGQFGPLNQSGRALRNESDGRRTNREGKVCIQIEVCGRASKPWTDGWDPGKKPNWQKFIAACRAWGVPDVWPAGALAVTSVWPTSRSSTIWRSKGGHYGHCNIPGNCVTADTPVLCADLTWRPAGDLLPGDELIGFDVDSPDQQGRRLKRSVVTHNELRRDALYRVVTAEGTVRCNGEHPWLVRVKRRGDADEWGSWKWVKTEDLSAGDEVKHVLEPWETERSWKAGWLAGMYDGEGSLCVNKSGVFLECSQRVSPTADRMLEQIKERVPVYGLRRSQHGLGSTDMIKATIQKRSDALRMLGMVRPERLLEKADAVWENATIGKLGGRSVVESVEPCGTGVIAALSTSTETYIAGGFAMHNTHWDPGNVDKTKILYKPSTSAPSTGSYTVRKGDTVSKIAVLYGTTVDVLVKLNGLKDADSIDIGQVLKVPVPKTTLYTVRSGDTLWRIAKDHATTVAKLKTANALKSDGLDIGQVLKIPS